MKRLFRDINFLLSLFVMFCMTGYIIGTFFFITADSSLIVFICSFIMLACHLGIVLIRIKMCKIRIKMCKELL